MAVLFDAAANAIQTTTSTCVLGMTIANVAGSVLLVGVYNAALPTSISAVYANGIALTQIGRTTYVSASLTVTLFGITNPPFGTVSISCQTVGGLTPVLGMMAASYNGSGGWGDYVPKSNASLTSNAVIVYSTSNTGRVVLFGACKSTFTAMNATTRLSDVLHLSLLLADAAGTGTTFSLSVSSNASSQAMIFGGINLYATIVGGNTVGLMMMLGAGS